ncbi:MAG: electron transport complex subunit E [Bacteroidales bacterium]|nr:electron transport complex subunit E [Bacteroidales bacterium]MBN2821502.1 electron transport complex subunit E [Bacteroidales bacterium]
MNQWRNFIKGFIKENPVFVLFLGMCPTLGTTSSAINGIGMGLATTFVLVLSNVFISLTARFIPDKVRIPSYIVIIASFVTVVDLIMKAYTNTPGPNGEPSLYDNLGLFIPLIVVNCIVLGRAEAFASKNSVFSSFIDGFGIGLGFTFALFILGSVREILGSGTFLYPALNFKFIKGDGMLAFVLAPGAFLALGYLIAIMNIVKKRFAK